MIIGVGIDIVENARIERIYKEKAKQLIKRLLSQKEKQEFLTLKDTRTKISFLCKRFAVKEALGKAIGCGINNEYLTVTDITISHDKVGKPIILKNSSITNAIRKFYHTSNYGLLVSIADEKEYSTAIVIIQENERGLINFIGSKFLHK